MNSENCNTVIAKTLHPGVKPKLIDVAQVTAPIWIEMINDLVVGAGYSYSRIAYRINVSPSTIQKLATNLNRSPREHVFQNLLNLYQRVFHGPYTKPQATLYWQQKEIDNQERALAIKNLLQRGFI